MKIIFLSMLAATALSTLSFVPNRISDSKDNINIVEVEDDYLEEPVRQVISHDPNDFWGAQSDLYNDLNGGWQEWNYEYLYVEPSDFIHKANTNYYELNTRLRIHNVQEWNKGSLTYLGMLDYTEVYWYYDDVVYNVDQCALDIVLRTRNPNTIGGMYFFYTYYNIPTPPVNNGPSPLWHEKVGIFDYLDCGWQEWNYAAIYAEPTKFSKYGNKNVYEMTAQLPVEVEEWERTSVTYIGLENCTGIHFTLERVIYDLQTSTLNITLHAATPYVTGTLYFFYTYYRMLQAPANGAYIAPMESDDLVHASNDDLQLTYGTFSSKGTKDNKPEDAVKVTTDTFKLTGKINKYSLADKILNGLGDQDEDWYRFTINPGTLDLHIIFSSPNNGYQMTLYRFRCPTDMYPKANELYYRFGIAYACNGVFDETPGTYFIKVTAPESRVTSDSYEITVTATQTNNYFPLCNWTKSNYKAVVWENDFIPDSIDNRWEDNMFELKSQSYNNGFIEKTGYFDPIFYESGLNLDKKILDSVIYLWSGDEMKVFKKTLTALKTAFVENELKLRRYKRIQAEVTALVEGGIALVLSGISIYTGYFESSILLTKIDTIATIGEFTNALGGSILSICNLILGTVAENIDEFTVTYSALGELITACDCLHDNLNGVICIPIYGQMERIASPDNSREIWVYRRTFSPYQRKYMSTDESEESTNRFYFDRISEVQKMYTYNGLIMNGIRTFHGKVKAFKTIESFEQYISFDNWSN